MCNAQAAMASLVSVQGALNFFGQQQQAKAQQAAQARDIALERQRLGREQTGQLLQKFQQEESEARKMEQLALEQRAREATGVVAMGEAGVEQEATQQALIADYGRVRAAAARQKQYRDIGYGLATEEAGFRSQQEIARLDRQVQRPNLALSLMETGVKAARTYREFAS